MPFRPTFECLWCATPWTVRGADDIEGFAQLCPSCVGRAGENGFLRFRLKAALAERARLVAPEHPIRDDDWYLRRGRHARGPIHDQAWEAELDQLTRWLDALPISGEIVELAAGIGWWSPLLASKGTLSIYDAAEAPLERARQRLVAHGLRAHLHVRDAFDPPDRQVDALFGGFVVGDVPRARTEELLSIARRWLRPGGLFAFVDVRSDPRSGAPVEPNGADAPVGLPYDVVELQGLLKRAGFAAVEVGSTARFFLTGHATA